jgi:hypothetical protein
MANLNILQDSGDFIFNLNPSERHGHKWRLKSLWKELREAGLQMLEINRIWDRIADLVIKSILSGTL